MKLSAFFVVLFFLTFLAMWAFDGNPNVRDCGVDGYCPPKENDPR